MADHPVTRRPGHTMRRQQGRGIDLEPAGGIGGDVATGSGDANVVAIPQQQAADFDAG